MFLTTAYISVLSKGGYLELPFQLSQVLPLLQAFLPPPVCAVPMGIRVCPRSRAEAPAALHASRHPQTLLCSAPDLPREDPPTSQEFGPNPQRWLPLLGAEDGMWKDPEHCPLSPVWVVGGDVGEGWVSYTTHLGLLWIALYPCLRVLTPSTHERGFIWG